MAASSRMATQPTLLLRQPTTTGHRRYTSAAFSLPSPHPSLRLTLSKPHSLPFAKPFKSRISASVSAEPTNPHPNILTGSTRTVTTLVAVGLAASKFFAHSILKTAVEMKEPLLQTAGPAFFAAAKNYQTGSLNTPLTVVAAGMAKWLDMYSGVLMVRVLLSWFPNIPWDRQPLSAIRDLCDPYLNLFRNIIPPIFDTLDVSPLLAFAVLGTLAAILNSSRRSYW